MLDSNKLYKLMADRGFQEPRTGNLFFPAYIYTYNPLDCTSTYKFEKSGLSLIENINICDPSALIGLPLLSLVRLFKKAREPIPYVKSLPE